MLLMYINIYNNFAINQKGISNITMAFLNIFKNNLSLENPLRDIMVFISNFILLFALTPK